MKNLSILILTIVTLSFLVSSCGIQGEGAIIQESIDVSDFDGVELAGGFDVEVTLGDVKSVVAEGQQNIIDRLITDVQNDGTLKLKLERGVYRNYDLKIFVTVPSADKFCISGAGDMDIYQAADPSNQVTEDLKLRVSGAGNLRGHGDFFVNSYTDAKISGSGNIDFDINTNTIDAIISGSGNIAMGLIASQKADAKITGSGDISFFGDAPDLDIKIVGSGDFHGFDFDTDKTKVNITGSGNVDCRVQNDLDVCISGSGDVFYKGFPAINTDISGSGSIQSAN